MPAEGTSGLVRPGHFSTYEVAVSAIGKALADAALEVSRAPFPEFRSAMAAMGYPLVCFESHEGLPGSRPTTPAMANAALCLRYPFLVPWSRWTREVIWPDAIADVYRKPGTFDSRNLPFGVTELDGMPDGWRARFGLEMCEDVRTLLVRHGDAEAPGRYLITRLAEEVGHLVWEGVGEPADAVDDLKNLVTLYGVVGARTCIVCGGLEGVRRTAVLKNDGRERGRFFHQCRACHREALAASGNTSPYDEDAAVRFYNASRKDGKRVEHASQIPHAVLCCIKDLLVDARSATDGGIRDEAADLLEWAASRDVQAYGTACLVDRLRHERDTRWRTLTEAALMVEGISWPEGYDRGWLFWQKLKRRNGQG